MHKISLHTCNSSKTIHYFFLSGLHFLNIKLDAPPNSTQKIKLMEKRWAIHLYFNTPLTCRLRQASNVEIGVGCNYLLSYYLANKRSLHIRSQGLKIPTLIEEK